MRNWTREQNKEAESSRQAADVTDSEQIPTGCLR